MFVFSTIIGFVYLYALVGITCLFTLGIIIAMLILQYVIMKKMIRVQNNYLSKKAERVKKTEEVFNNIRFIKSNCLETFFTCKLDDIRCSELKKLWGFIEQKLLVVTITWLNPTFMMISTFAAFMLAGNEMSVANIFTILSLLRNIQYGFSSIPHVVISASELLTSSTNLFNFYSAEEKQAPKNMHTPHSENDVCIQNGQFRWDSYEQRSAYNRQANVRKNSVAIPQQPNYSEPFVIERSNS